MNLMQARSAEASQAIPPQDPLLSAELQLQRGERSIRCQLALREQQTLAIIGPNGAGKTSVLRALAGFLPIQAGRIVHRDLGLFDDGDPDHLVAPEQRQIGMVFQDDRLFPHLDLRSNIAFGLEQATRSQRAAAREQADDWLEQIGLLARAEALPAELSGGERQRVALARALAPHPSVLLLDEPLAAVDASQRPALRALLKRMLRKYVGACVLVTHDAVDAFTLTQEVAVLEEGTLTQTGTVAEICRRPRSRFVADLIGVNLILAKLEEGRVHTWTGHEIVVADTAGLADGPVLLTLHPRAIALFPERPSGSPRNVWQAEVAAIEPTGDRLRVRLEGALHWVAEVTPAALAELRIEVGRPLWLAFKATELEAFPA